jgi:hypothetical protein
MFDRLDNIERQSALELFIENSCLLKKSPPRYLHPPRYLRCGAGINSLAERRRQQVASKVTIIVKLTSHPIIKRLNDSESYDLYALSRNPTKYFYIRALAVCAHLTLDLSKVAKLEPTNRPQHASYTKRRQLGCRRPHGMCHDITKLNSED